jgi:hypothetical protein
MGELNPQLIDKLKLLTLIDQCSNAKARGEHTIKLSEIGQDAEDLIIEACGRGVLKAKVNQESGVVKVIIHQYVDSFGHQPRHPSIRSTNHQGSNLKHVL